MNYLLVPAILLVVILFIAIGIEIYNRKRYHEIINLLEAECEALVRKENELVAKEEELKKYEVNLDAVADKLNFTTTNSREFHIEYCVSQSDEEKYTSEATMNTAVRRHLSDMLAKQFTNEFTPKKEVRDNGSKYSLVIRAKQL